ncbi:30S ribosomal protein S5 [Patescibacteria group bacterium]|nr:30S ribosomal protein S5 [Patescibacteria group bacterium]
MQKRELEKKEYEQKLLGIARVVRVVAGGRRFRFRAVMVIGDKNGKVGVGVSKGQDVSIAVEKAVADAKKNIVKVPIVNETIPHSVEAKFSSARIMLKPAAKGRGIVVGGPARAVCDLAGIKNISGKILGKTKNKISNAKVTILALSKLRIREKENKGSK